MVADWTKHRDYYVIKETTSDDFWGQIKTPNKKCFSRCKITDILEKTKGKRENKKLYIVFL